VHVLNSLKCFGSPEPDGSVAAVVMLASHQHVGTAHVDVGFLEPAAAKAPEIGVVQNGDAAKSRGGRNQQAIGRRAMLPRQHP